MHASRAKKYLKLGIFVVIDIFLNVCYSKVSYFINILEIIVDFKTRENFVKDSIKILEGCQRSDLAQKIKNAWLILLADAKKYQGRGEPSRQEILIIRRQLAARWANVMAMIWRLMTPKKLIFYRQKAREEYYYFRQIALQ